MMMMMGLIHQHISGREHCSFIYPVIVLLPPSVLLFHHNFSQFILFRLGECKISVTCFRIYVKSIIFSCILSFC